MATANPITSGVSFSFPVTDERRALAIQSAHELDEIANVLLERVEPWEPETLFMRCIALRLKGLASVSMSALDDSSEAAVIAAHRSLSGSGNSRGGVHHE